MTGESPSSILIFLNPHPRDKMYKFFMSLKQPDGSFLVAHHAEVDVRGIYCLLASAQLLNLITPELVEGTPAFIASCQTYEGGFASASHPSFAPGSPPTLLSAPRPPLGEAHGGYTFCALAAWVILRPFAPPDVPAINKQALLRWLVHMQGGPAELGGFKGRTNKLVDGCYSWWVGGAFALLEALNPGAGGAAPTPTRATDDADEAWDDIDGPFCRRCTLAPSSDAPNRCPLEPRRIAGVHTVCGTAPCGRAA